jgi:iron complex outermembrane recepter protein
VNRFVLLGSSALVSLATVVETVRAQEQPADVTIERPVVVTTPSPIQRRPTPRPPVAPAARTARAPQTAPTAPTPQPEPVVAAPQPGTLPIVTDQFATVTVVPNEELRRAPGGTLGDLLFSKPGITGSSFAPGASSRPIVRGLDVNRVGIAENGIGANGASDLGEDHFVPLDPLSLNQLEVIRGPATLRYGSQSIGGIVNGANNRIPETLPCAGPPERSISGAGAPAERPCVSFETRGIYETVNNGREGAALLDIGGSNIAIHVDTFARQTDDYRVPKYPYLTPPDPAISPNATQPFQFDGRQPNSSMKANGYSVGGSYVFSEGFFGVAYTRNNSLYHVPGIDAEDHHTRLDAHQDKWTSKGEWRPMAYAIDTIRFWAGTTDYRHNELGLADSFDLTSDGRRQTFTNKEQEGRAEITLMPMNLQFATLTTAVGVQGGQQRLTAPGDTNDPGNGLWDPNKNHRVAGFIFNEFKFSDITKGQLAGRVESVDLSGTARIFPGNGDLVQTPVSRTYTPKSASVGLIQNLPWDLVGSVTAQYVERAPKPAEMFSGGVHDATATFDIGNPNLSVEVAKSFEAGIRRNTSPFRFELTGFYTQFTGFIFRALSGDTCDEGIDTCTGPLGAPGAAGGPLQQALYSQKDATFRGVEFQSQYDALPLWTGIFGIENQFDLVRATFTDGTNVPRIPPVRVGGGVFWRDDNWLARVNLLHAFSHTDIAPIGETTTPGYNNLKAEISYRWKPARLTRDNLSEIVVGVSSNNLLNDDIRNSVTYFPQKDEVLMPGRSVKFFANVKY